MASRKIRSVIWLIDEAAGSVCVSITENFQHGAKWVLVACVTANFDINPIPNTY